MDGIGHYFITDDKLSLKGNVSDVKQALSSGVKFIQYRAKNKTTQEMFKEALILKGLCKKAFFLINDRLDIALAVSADGVHLGQDDLSPDVEWGSYPLIGQTAGGELNAKTRYQVEGDQLIRFLMDEGGTEIDGTRRVIANQVNEFLVDRYGTDITIQLKVAMNENDRTEAYTENTRTYDHTFQFEAVLRNTGS